MDQIKIGKFISNCRKEKGLTQVKLAEHLGVTDRAVSKWETGKSLPDASIMLELTEALDISVNELLTGEKIKQEDYKNMAENNLLELKKQEELSNKALLHLEVIIGVVGTFAFLMFVFTAAYVEMDTYMKAILIVSGCLIFAVTVAYAMKIEREAGYYECKKCGNKYVPDAAPIIFAPHMGRTRYMKCPRCGVKSWQKKVLTK